MSEERLWIGGSCIYPESELDRCCRWTIYRSGVAESGEPVECGACGMGWHAEGTIRDYRCGCSIGPEFTHLCKRASELESALFEAASDHAITEEFPGSSTLNRGQAAFSTSSNHFGFLPRHPGSCAGGTGYVNNSSIDQRCSVIPAAIAGVLSSPREQ